MYKMNELSIKIVYSGFRKLTTRDVLMALNDYFRGSGQGDKMEIKSVSSPAVEAVAEIERQQEQIETLRNLAEFWFRHNQHYRNNCVCAKCEDTRAALEATKEQS